MNERKQVDVVHSIVSAEAIVSAIADEYQLGDITDYHFVSSTLSDIYRLSTKSGNYFVRLTAAHRTTQQDPVIELAALRYLHSHGGRVASPVLNTTGSPFITVHAPEGDRILAVFESAPGRYIEFTTSDYHLLGTSLAALHEVGSAVGHEFGGRRLDLGFLLDGPLDLLRRHAITSHDLFNKIAASVRTKIKEGCTTEVRKGFCHGDAWANINIGADGTATFFDFDLCGVGWPIYDVATVKWGFWFECQRREFWEPLWEAFWAGYCVRTGLSRAEVELIPLFTIARDIWSMGNLLANAHRWGYRRLTPDYFAGRLQRTQALEQALPL